MDGLIEKITERLNEARFPITDLKRGVFVNGIQQTDMAVLYEKAVEIIREEIGAYRAVSDGFPLFQVCKPSKAELEIEKYQSPILEKLSNAGYGVKVGVDVYMDMPCRLDDDNFPIEVCRCITDKLVICRSFRNWKEIEEFADSIGKENMILHHKAVRIDNGEEVKGFLTKMWGQYHITTENDENTAYPVIEETITPCYDELEQ